MIECPKISPQYPKLSYGFFVVIPRIYGLSLLMSTFTSDDASLFQMTYYAIFVIVFFVLHVLGSLKILMRIRGKISNADQDTSKVLDHHFILAMIPSIMSPYGIFLYGSSYLTLSALMTSFLQIVALGTNVLISMFIPSLQIKISDDVVKHSLALIPILACSNLAVWLIQILVHWYNDIYRPLVAIHNDDEEQLEDIMEEKKHDFNMVIPGDQDLRSILLLGNIFGLKTITFPNFDFYSL